MMRRRPHKLSWLGVAVLLLMAGVSRAALIGPAEHAIVRPTQEIDPANCLTSDCHSEVSSYDVIHGPVAAKTCDACHQLVSAEDHTFELWRQDEKVCTFCHEFDTGMLPVVHKPVILGECLGCHNPHGGVDHSLTREATMSETCGRCHESVTFGRQFVHDPVQTGECNTCHRSHASRYPMLLDVVGTDLCLTCHGDFEEEMAAVEFRHEALDEGCSTCHDPHGADYPMNVSQSVPVMCLECHEEIKARTEAAVEHPAVMDERACLTCHTAHGGNLASLMRDLPVHVCMDCHEEKIEKEGVELITAMVRIDDATRFKHTPVREGQCGGCHTIHGGDKPLLLLDEYSTLFYQGFSGEQYDLCFECHDERLLEDGEGFDDVGELQGDGASTGRQQGEDEDQGGWRTRFRNGNRNLHLIHVAEGNFPHNCRVCHGVHTSKYPSLVRDRVPFGNWQMDIRFEQTLTGGTCMTGCHPEYSYDRVTPVAMKSALPPEERRLLVPSADKREPVMVEAFVTDIHGGDIAIPDRDRARVLVFLRGDQPQSREVVDMVSAASPEIDAAEVAAVFCGRNAEQQAWAFASADAVPWAVVADPDHELSGKLGVEAWPATLVVQTDGTVLAHVGGAPPSLTMELTAYLDFAARKIDRTALTERLADYQLVRDTPAIRAAWHLQMGRKLAAQGRTGEARGMFADGLTYQPDSVELQVELIRSLVALSEAQEGLRLLTGLPEGALPPWEYGLLRGRMLAIQGNWKEAGRLAEEVLSQKPGLGEAHYLMGQVYENQGDWEKAAEEYRAAYPNGG